MVSEEADRYADEATSHPAVLTVLTLRPKACPCRIKATTARLSSRSDSMTAADLILLSRLCLLFLTVLLLVRLLVRRAGLPPVNLPPGPRGVPFLGFLPFLDHDFHLTLTRLSQRFGPVYQIFLGGKRVVVLSDARLVREAFRQPVFSGRPDTELTRILQGYGIVNSEGALWKEQRAFLHTVLRHLGAKSLMVGKNGLESKIKTQVQGFISDLKSCAGQPLAVRPFIARAVSNVVGSLLMSMTFDDREDKNFLRLLELIDEGFKLFTVAMPVNFVPLFRYIPGVNYAYRKIKGNRAETSEFFRKIADQHRASLDPDNIRDIVDAYLVRQAEDRKQETYFSEAQLIQIMNDLFSAGLETVTSTIEWAVLFLMKHRGVQDRLFAEVQCVIGDRSAELDDLANMPYTEATIYEVLRRSNVIALGNAHAALQDATLAGYFIPKDTHVLSNLYAIHMDPNLWERPDQFDPTRFLRNGKAFKPDFFIPFSVGRRMCLGDVLAKMEVFLFLTTIVQNYELRVPHNEEAPSMTGSVAASIVPKPFRVSLIPRIASLQPSTISLSPSCKLSL